MTHPSQVRRSLSASRVLRKAVWHSEVMDSILGSGDCVCVCVSHNVGWYVNAITDGSILCACLFVCV